MTYTWPDILTGLVRREGLEAEACLLYTSDAADE